MSTVRSSVELETLDSPDGSEEDRRLRVELAESTVGSKPKDTQGNNIEVQDVTGTTHSDPEDGGAEGRLEEKGEKKDDDKIPEDGDVQGKSGSEKNCTPEIVSVLHVFRLFSVRRLKTWIRLSTLALGHFRYNNNSFGDNPVCFLVN